MTFAALTNPNNINTMALVPMFSLYQLVLPLSAFAAVSSEPLSVSSGVVIAQLQTGAVNAASQELVTIYNNSDLPIDVSHWCITYSSSSDASQTTQACIAPPQNTKLNLESHEYVSFATSEFSQAHPTFKADYQIPGGFSASAGHIKLLDARKAVIDTLAWGSAVHPEGIAAVAHATGKTLQRTGVNQLQDTDNNNIDFAQNNLSLTVQSGLYEEQITTDSRALFITELLPDAPGIDTGKEFIEFYNPNDQPLNLTNYQLQIGPAFAKTYPLPDLEVPANGYRALSDIETGVTLPNGSASARLLAANQEVLAVTESYDQPGEAVAWAYANETWQLTQQPTPGAANNIVTPRDNPPVSFTEPLACQKDQERNSATGRCRKIPTVSALAICAVGQVRNVATGRCRSVTNAVLGLIACKTGQQRKPTTGRCSKIMAPIKPKPCPAGQEKNTTTNRCRKSANAVTSPMNKVQDVASPLLKNDMKWWLAGAGGVGSVGYAGYEWRREAIGFILSIKERFK